MFLHDKWICLQRAFPKLHTRKNTDPAGNDEATVRHVISNRQTDPYHSWHSHQFSSLAVGHGKTFKNKHHPDKDSGFRLHAGPFAGDIGSRHAREEVAINLFTCQIELVTLDVATV